MLPLIPTLGAFFTSLMLFLFVFVCLFMMLVILIQKPRGGGLSGAFGGAGGSSSSVFGSKTGDVLTWVTVICFCVFVGLAMILTWSINPEVSDTPTPNTVLPGSDDGTTGGKLGDPIEDSGKTGAGTGTGTSGTQDGTKGGTTDGAAKEGAAKDS